jgi:hypothetical protein
MADSVSFFPARGCVFIVGKTRGGSFRLSPELKGTDKSPILVQGADFGVNEAFSKQTTLTGRRFLYAFGQEMGDITINLLLLLGSAEADVNGGAPEAAAWKSLLEYYQAHCLSKSDEPVQVSMPGNVAKSCFLIGLRMSPPDPEFNTAVAQLIGVVAENNVPTS